MSDSVREKAIDLIQNKYGKMMHKIGYEILQDWHYVEDVEQEVLCKLIMHHQEKTMLPPAELKSYLRTAVKNTAINMGIKNYYIAKAEEKYFLDIPLSMTFVDVEAFQDKYGFGSEITELLNNLSNIDRNILCLQYGEGYQIKEIAEALGVNSEYVKKRAYRAKIKLKSIVVEKEEVEL